MGTIHLTTRGAILGIALTLSTIPLLFHFATDPQIQDDDSLTPLEFTDVRIIRLNLSVPHSESDIVRSITIDPEFNFYGCHSDSSATLPCPVQLWDEEHAWLWKHMRTQQNIPSL
jgi:hypothetical protein